MTDYSNMSLHEELETRFADAERRRQEEDFLSRGWQPPAELRPLTDDEKALAYEQVESIRPKRNFTDKVSEFVVTNPASRAAGFALQGISNAGLNPAGYLARSFGVNTSPLMVENGVERGIEQGAATGYDLSALSVAGNIAKGSGLLGQGHNAISISAQGLLSGEVVPAAASGFAGGFLDGVLNPASAAGQFAANALGGWLGTRGIQNTADSYLPQAKYWWHSRKMPADKEVLDFTPTREQLAAIKPESKFNPNKYTKEEADALFRERANQQGLGIYNDDLSYVPEAVENRYGIQHLLGKERNPFVRTLNNTINNPDVRFSSEGRNFVAKMYKDADTGKNFMDYIITENGDIVTKYPTKVKRVANQIKKSAQNMSLSGRVLQVNDGATYAQLPAETITKIPRFNAVVNSALPHVSSVYRDLSPYQSDVLQSAISKGIKNSRYPAGSWDSLNKARRYLNSVSGSERLSGDMGVARRNFNEVLGTALEREGYSKAAESLRNLNGKTYWSRYPYMSTFVPPFLSADRDN